MPFNGDSLKNIKIFTCIYTVIKYSYTVIKYSPVEFCQMKERFLIQNNEKSFIYKSGWTTIRQ